MQESWVCSLAWEDLLVEGTATHSSILAWRIHMDRGGWRTVVHGVTESWMRLSSQAHTAVRRASLAAQMVKNAENLGSTPGSGRSPEAGNGNPLQ